MTDLKWYVIEQLALPLVYTEEDIRREIRHKTGLGRDEIIDVVVEKISIDARKKPRKILTCRFLTGRQPDKGILWEEPLELVIPDLSNSKYCNRIGIIGAGPAGLSCAWLLSKAGLNPVIIESGSMAHERSIARKKFMESGVYTHEGSLLWGEGGAGTFSDGKLTTRRNEPLWWNTFKLMLLEAGVPGEVLIQSHPHLGTDVLLKILPVLRNQITNAGGKFIFNQDLNRIQMQSDEIVCNFESGDLSFLKLIVATGGNNTNIPLMLENIGVTVNSRSLQIGLRMEHKSSLIDKARYGQTDVKYLGHAEYNFSDSDGKIRTFCMCPGGEVVCASGYKGHLTVNGMSYSQRNGIFSNSALITSLDGFSWKESLNIISRIEEECFKAGGNDYGAPFQTIRDFLDDRLSMPTDSSYLRSLRPAIIGKLFPGDYTDRLKRTLSKLSRFLPGISDGTLIAPESRVTPPWQYSRNKDGTVLKDIYAIGEGSGHSSGISTSAMDGLKVAAGIVGLV
ncbi:NAD(P)-binding protein [Myxococcota bacterium]|nr:NAD(P)-binding protein [Myxococcota bacterium]MBU1382352.1 NAD(P)-binding protein [Myxococcota bacterium]MBU1498689.1 NAD(P)-binding protein [Myxococcota bacterium]